MTYQITLGFSNSVWGVWSQEPVKELETIPVPTIRNPTGRPSYPAVTHLQSPTEGLYQIYKERQETRYQQNK